MNTTNNDQEMAEKGDNSEVFKRIYEDYKKMGVELNATIADATAAFVSRHENPKDVSSDIIIQWVDQNTELDIQPDNLEESSDVEAIEWSA